MAKIDITKTELVWQGKYNEDGTLAEVPRVSLPFQVIETINESRATREANKLPQQGTLFDVYEGKEGDTFEAGWSNKLIWGDNLLVMGSLLEKFAGKIDLIYIDPPFATGADFSFSAPIGEGDLGITKEQSAMEEKAYRDTWGRGLDSYLSMMYGRLVLMRDLLSERGTIYVHCDWRVNSHIRLLLDEICGVDNLINEITWKRSNPHNDTGRFGAIHDTILIYARSSNYIFETQYAAPSKDYIESHFTTKDSETGERYTLMPLMAQGPGPARKFGNKTLPPPPGTHWRWTQERIDSAVKSGLIVFTSGGTPRYKFYERESKGRPIQSIWDDIVPINSQSAERLNYETQKPEGLLERVVKCSSLNNSLVLDCFAGSGTTLAVAEKLGRRWIGCDLGRHAIHTTRKRLLEIENCHPFEVLNLGRYERQYWQGATFGKEKQKTPTEQSLYEYLAFILKLYGAQPVAGMANLHGKKGKAMIHIGAVDAPVTIDEVNQAVEECVRVKQTELHVLGWEWEMGLAEPNDAGHKGGMLHDIARQKGVRLLFLQIPREVMEQQATAKGDVHFFELAYLEAEIEKPKKLTVKVALKDFVIPNTELIPEDVRSKVKKWSDYIDYWAIDWNFQNDTFMQGWVAYRTRKERKLPLVSDTYTYEKPGKYRILVKVIDIFGNDTSQAFDAEVK